MRRIDLDEPRFTQAQVLQCVPGLTPKTLQNWLAPARGIIPIHQRPGRQGKIRWSALQIVALSYMVLVVRLGIPPHASFALSTAVKTRALHLHKSIDPVPEGEVPNWHAGVLDYDQLYVVSDQDQVYRQYFKSTEYDLLRSSSPGAYIVIEVDRLVLDSLNLIYRLPDAIAADAASSDGDAGSRGEREISGNARRASGIQR
jgi:hypothetical protein